MFHRWLFAHTNPENVDRFVSVSASHPNLIWDNLQSNYAINDYWLKFIQLPYLPEIEMTRSDSKFIERMLPHLSRELINKSKYIQNDSVIQQIPKKLDAYKYVKVLVFFYSLLSIQMGFSFFKVCLQSDKRFLWPIKLL